MNSIYIRELQQSDKDEFLSATQRSQPLHNPWVKAPLTAQEFDEYFLRSQQANQKSILVCNDQETILGVFNLNEIIRGGFQNAFLGFYAVIDYSGKGYMSTGLKLTLKLAFEDLGLHRVEANIQPENARSIQLIKNNGFRYEGYSPYYLKINDEWRGHEHWAMTLEDYQQNNSK